MRYRGTSGIARVRKQTKRWRDRTVTNIVPERQDMPDVDLTLGAPCTCTCPRCLAGEHGVCGRIACEERTK